MKPELETFLQQILPVYFAGRYTLEIHTNRKGVSISWCRLASSDDLLAVAESLQRGQARLSTVTATLPERAREAGRHDIAYHFDLDGDTLTVTVQIPLEGEVDSLSSIFRTAEWNEREFMELYNIKVRGCPSHQRLFLDESIDAGVLDRLVPFSALVNAASTKTLWERILGAREEQK
ncbi:MAG TPA: NADH-quinone oxidoreductase subunit C [Candidatus Saccharimonadales bacterium]|nr:NADH-quinone oxidoreductase subunit C [Candidatus Saccharimonadales bacterium]